MSKAVLPPALRDTPGYIDEPVKQVASADVGHTQHRAAFNRDHVGGTFHLACFPPLSTVRTPAAAAVPHLDQVCWSVTLAVHRIHSHPSGARASTRAVRSHHFCPHWCLWCKPTSAVSPAAGCRAWHTQGRLVTFREFTLQIASIECRTRTAATWCVRKTEITQHFAAA